VERVAIDRTIESHRTFSFGGSVSIEMSDCVDVSHGNVSFEVCDKSRGGRGIKAAAGGPCQDISRSGHVRHLTKTVGLQQSYVHAK
jgi:hypothetical protein